MMNTDEAKDQLTNMERSYNNAVEEQARSAFVIGGIYLNAKKDYSEALKWFQIVYNLSVAHFSEKALLLSCQSLGEVYFRLNRLSDALIYQKNQLKIAKDIDDLVEQHRACSQLGRTYHERFVTSNDDEIRSLRKAKKYFNSALKLAKTLKENNNSSKHSFVKEYIDSHIIIGMIEVDRGRFDKAEKYLTKGLRICDEEKVDKNDESRARFHHHLGSVYMELKKWDEARQHIEKDIEISRNTCHRLGQAKGFINLGELHYRLQEYDAATLSNQKAMEFVDDENLGLLGYDLDGYGSSSFKGLINSLSAYVLNNKLV